MCQLNIDRDHNGTFCWSVWEMDEDDYCREIPRGVMRESGQNCHTLTEAIAFGIHALLDLSANLRKR